MQREARPLYCVGNRLRASSCITEGITHTSILAIKIAWEEIAVGGHVCLHVLFLYFVLCPRCFTNLRPKAVWKILPTHGGWWLEEGKYNNQTQNTGARGKVRIRKGGRDEKWSGKWGQKEVSYLLLLSCCDVPWDKYSISVLSGPLKRITDNITSCMRSPCTVAWLTFGSLCTFGYMFAELEISWMETTVVLSLFD